ncbi:tetratricopeptide repeat protein [Amycolatopsis plumensis]|uniref:Tetratricopeptide repeat protein n=1 Tax=Amycolatopsis plumensis TaxID=236508 RepID=A0ABV5UB21_9PSEU
MVWLDDLEEYLGPAGLTSSAVAYLKRAGVAIVATIRGEQYRKFVYSPLSHAHEDLDLRSDFQRILDLSQSVLVPRRWSDTELARAAQSNDSRVIEAVKHSDSFGVAEYLAAGPRLLEEWMVAWGAEMNPRGASLIAVAVDFARAGISESIPRSLLVDLHGLYLENAGGALLRPEGIDQAFSWSTRRRSGVASPLISVNEGRSYRAFDYLVDSWMRDDSNKPIPQEVWEKSVELAQITQDLTGVAYAARRHSAVDIEAKSWSLLAKSGNPLGAMQLGHLYTHIKERESAYKWYEKAAELGNPDGFTYIGIAHENLHDTSGAEDFYRRAADAGDAHGMNHLALLLRKKGKVNESEHWYRTAVITKSDGEYPLDASINLAQLLAETDRLDEAEAIYRQAAESGKDEALSELGYLLARSGRKTEARRLWLEAVEKGIASAAANLALDAEVENNYSAAETWWNKAIDLGFEPAVMRLAIMLDTSDKSRHNEAENLFKRAIELEIEGASYSYAVFFFRQNRYEEAVQWARKSAELKEEHSPRLLASILEQIPDSKGEAISWWEQAAKDGDRDAQAQLGELLSETENYEDAVEWLTLAAESGDIPSMCTLGWVHYRLGNYTESDRLFRAASDAGHAHAACNHGSSLLYRGDIDAALERYKAAYFAGHTHVAEDIEKICRSTGRGREAAEWLRRSKTGFSRPAVKKSQKKRGRKKR